jgi:hypothetical protein
VNKLDHVYGRWKMVIHAKCETEREEKNENYADMCRQAEGKVSVYGGG